MACHRTTSQWNRYHSLPFFSHLSLYPYISPVRTHVTWWNTQDGLIILVTEEAWRLARKQSELIYFTDFQQIWGISTTVFLCPVSNSIKFKESGGQFVHSSNITSENRVLWVQWTRRWKRLHRAGAKGQFLKGGLGLIRPEYKEWILPAEGATIIEVAKSIDTKLSEMRKTRVFALSPRVYSNSEPPAGLTNVSKNYGRGY